MSTRSSLLTVALLGGCSGSPATVLAPAAALPERPSLAQVALPTPDGTVIAFDERLALPLVVVVVGPACDTCTAELAALDVLREEGGFEVVGVFAGPPDALGALLGGLKVGFPLVIADTPAALSPFGELRAVPTSLLLNQSGQVVDRFYGLLPKSYLRRRIASVSGVR